MGLLENSAPAPAMAAAGEAPVLPCPGFEGFEKRLEVQFQYCPGETAPLDPSSRGLRNIPLAELETMLAAAQCSIVSRLSNKHFDSYVLSESSLFVYPTAVMIKTCGTTHLLRAIPQLLASAAALHYEPSRCRYTRGSFIFPEAQPAPHHDFAAESAVLEEHFGRLGGGGRAYVLGDALSGCNWHIYMADATPFAAWATINASAAVAEQGKQSNPVLTLEVCMTKLDQKAAGRFFFGEEGTGKVDAKAVTTESGIQELLPHSSIDDFCFTPCGYSMNGIEEGRHSTIHITPEDGFSYASFEARGYAHDTTNLKELIGNVLGIFKPGSVSVAIHADGQVPAAVLGGKGDSWWSALGVPEGYWCCSSTQQQLLGGCTTVFHTFKAQGQDMAPAAAHPVTPLPLASPMSAAASSSPAKSGMAAKKAGAFNMGMCHNMGWEQVEISESAGLSEKEVTDAVLSALSRRGEGVVHSVSSLRPVLLAQGEAELDGLCRELIEARVAAAAAKGSEGAAMGAESAFYVMDAGEVLRLWDVWTAAMPRVHPFYAVKCNPDKALLGLLASLGAGFDVASLAELEAVSEVFEGAVPSERIIFANPCKLPTHISAAAARGVSLSTFDSESELQKLRRADPNAKAVLRIRVDDPSARCPLGVKYGAELGECRRLLYAARRLGVTVEGVAFHVGSGAGDAGAFALGVAAARQLFDIGAEVGFNMTLLDIGGGFTSDGGAAGGASFQEAAVAVSLALEEHFPRAMFPSLRVIAEPGRFFAESPYTLVAHVFGLRARGRGSKRRHEYWINDGIYGSMNSLLYDHAVLSVRPLRIASAATSPPLCPGGSPVADPLAPPLYPGRGKQNKLFSSTVFGPTCDGLDTVLRDVWLPKLQCGDWLVFPRMGAYTKAAGSSFNGFAVDDIKVAAYVLVSGMARPFYASAKGRPSSFGGFTDSGRFVDVALGPAEWGLLEGSGGSSEDEDVPSWEQDAFSSGSGSDSDE